MAESRLEVSGRGGIGEVAAVGCSEVGEGGEEEEEETRGGQRSTFVS